MAQIGSIVQESVRVKRKAIKLITKLLPVIEYHLCTSYGASSNYHGGCNNKQVGTGQGHVVSVNIYRDSTCIIFKDIEKEDLGIIIKALILINRE